MNPSTTYVPSEVEPANRGESSKSGVSWAAIFAGAFVAVAMSLILLVLGTGLGLGSISPWANDGASASTIGIGAIVWLVVMQLASAALGGYVGGRLRTKWVGVHNDEVFFRDTAHGLLVWAVATVIAAAFLTSAVGSVVSGTAKVAGAATATGVAAMGAGAAGMANTGEQPGRGAANDPSAYFVDMMFRADKPSADADNGALRREAGRIVATGIAKGEVSTADKAYLVNLVAARTGMSPADAEKRVTDVVSQAKAAAESAKAKAQQAADDARKAGAYLALWIFISLLIGAFCASVAATIGGRQRDEVLASRLS
jgi:hypothetical protein